MREALILTVDTAPHRGRKQLWKYLNPPALPEGITHGEDGKLRWSYTLNLWWQPVML